MRPEPIQADIDRPAGERQRQDWHTADGTRSWVEADRQLVHFCRALEAGDEPPSPSQRKLNARLGLSERRLGLRVGLRQFG